MDDDHGYSCVCPFLDDDPKYAHGVELGMLFERMRERGPIREYFTRANQDQIYLLASRLGWTVNAPSPPDDAEPWSRDWFWCEMEPPP
jgi:hypothetical protein